MKDATRQQSTRDAILDATELGTWSSRLIRLPYGLSAIELGDRNEVADRSRETLDLMIEGLCI